MTGIEYLYLRYLKSPLPSVWLFQLLNCLQDNEPKSTWLFAWPVSISPPDKIIKIIIITIIQNDTKYRSYQLSYLEKLLYLNDWSLSITRVYTLQCICCIFSTVLFKMSGGWAAHMGGSAAHIGALFFTVLFQMSGGWVAHIGPDTNIAGQPLTSFPIFDPLGKNFVFFFETFQCDFAKALY